MKWDWCDHSLLQLKSERSHRVLCTIASVASVSMRFRSNERGTRVKDRAKNGAFFTLVPFLSPSKPKIPYLCLSLLRNQMETLVTQAMCTIKGTESMLFCYTRNTNESNCELFVLLTAILTLLAILTMALYYRSIFYKNIKNWTRNDLTTLNSAIVFPWRQ